MVKMLKISLISVLICSVLSVQINMINIITGNLPIEIVQFFEEIPAELDLNEITQKHAQVTFFASSIDTSLLSDALSSLIIYNCNLSLNQLYRDIILPPPEMV